MPYASIFADWTTDARARWGAYQSLVDRGDHVTWCAWWMAEHAKQAFRLTRAHAVDHELARVKHYATRMFHAALQEYQES